LQAKQAISFFVHIIVKFIVRDGAFPQPVAMENHHTREKFEVTKATPECEKKRYSFWISRHPIEANSEWIEEMTKYEDHYEHGNIAVDFWSYLGICI
jgi:hypothetical protein